MLDRHARDLTTRLFTPVARTLLRAGVGPDTVTVVGDWRSTHATDSASSPSPSRGIA